MTESERLAEVAVRVEDRGSDVFDDGQVLARGPQVLPDRHDVDAGASRMPREQLPHFVPRLAEAEHQTGLRRQGRVQDLGRRQQAERAVEPRAAPHLR